LNREGGHQGQRESHHGDIYMWPGSVEYYWYPRGFRYSGDKHDLVVFGSRLRNVLAAARDRFDGS
jgi:hypothetical protein